MYEKIRFEWFVIKEVLIAVWWNIKLTRSLMPVIEMFNSNEAVFMIHKRGPWIKGNYYKYIKNNYSA